MEKGDVRKDMLAERARLSETFVTEASQKIYEQLIDMSELNSAGTVLVYADTGNEVRTGELTGWLLYKGKTVCLPVVTGGSITAVQYNGGPLHEGKFGIPVPDAENGRSLGPRSIDLVICPGLAFTSGLYRIGSGSGCYDRFFEDAPNAFRIGLAYGFQIVDGVSPEPHDVQMNAVVTPQRVMRL